jgi:hypothetical protein
MDRFAEKRSLIRQHQAQISAADPLLWSNMIAEWNSPSSHDCAWLMYSANYLFHTNHVRWAKDLLTLQSNEFITSSWRTTSTPKNQEKFVRMLVQDKDITSLEY